MKRRRRLCRRRSFMGDAPRSRVVTKGPEPGRLEIWLACAVPLDFIHFFEARNVMAVPCVSGQGLLPPLKGPFISAGSAADFREKAWA